MKSLSVSDSLQPSGLQPTRLLHPWDFPGKNTRVGCHFLLQGIFLTQGSNSGLPHCRKMLYPLSHQGSPKCPIEPLVLGDGGGQECHPLLQGSNPDLSTVSRTLYRLCYQGSLLHVKHCARHILGILSFNPYKNCGVEMILFPFYRIRN